MLSYVLVDILLLSKCTFVILTKVSKEAATTITLEHSMLYWMLQRRLITYLTDGQRNEFYCGGSRVQRRPAS